jgi:hypothetical protein
MIYVTTISFLLAALAWIVAFAANRRIDELQRSTASTRRRPLARRHRKAR